MNEKLMLVTLLHDVGKILLRAGEEPSCELGQEFYKHDRLTCDFIMEYLGREYVELFKEGQWKIADYASASERMEARTLGKPESVPLLDPALDVQPHEDLSKWDEESRWYPVTYVNFNATPHTYTARKRAKAQLNYEGIHETLRTLAEQAKSIVDPEALLETYDFIYRTVALFVPAAVYRAIPNTSLYGHSRLAAPLCVYDQVRLLVVDIKGIQKFITSARGEAESSKRLRGRSFFLQLLQRALSDKIADVLGISVLHNISFEPGKLILIVHDDLKSKVDEVLAKVEEWSNFEIQFASSISREKLNVRDIKIYDEKSRDDQFQKALQNVFKSLEIVGRPTVVEEVGVDYFGDIYPASRLVKTKGVDGIDSLTAGEMKEEDKISEINLISLIVGHSTRNLKFVVEVMYKDGTKGENGYRRIGVSNEYRVGEIYIEPLNVGFLLVQQVEDGRKGRDEYETKGREITALLQSLIQIKKESAKRIRIFKVNDTMNFIYPELTKLFDKISFGYITLSNYHPVDKQGKFISLDDMANYIAWGSLTGIR
ncbi:hypothetical protein [Metallosphaera hakonensis]|uniref:hypothetical protein n=1 Tax=Metallosphaera hakonensis TaxID=79601 RepID=UPI00209233AA|nr:hypothetical protein [Metallosphaera hakonensis]